MDKRQHPRIEIPLAVALMHPSLGTIETTARDISEGGLFLEMSDCALHVGAKVRVRMQTVSLIESQPTPTVDMQVLRIEADGVALTFHNKTAEHLWSSVERLRDHLEIGRDYFQIHQSVLLEHAERGYLFVQEHGFWKLPGHYLDVGSARQAALNDFLSDELGLQIEGLARPVSTQTYIHSALTEAATFAVIYQLETPDHHVTLRAQSRFRASRWVQKLTDLNDITINDEAMRQLVIEQLNLREADKH